MDELKSLFSSDQKTTSPPGTDEPPSYVVGIAASVGQPGTLGLFFDEMPVHSGMAFVIIQQPSANGTHLSCEMLSRHTEMPIYGEFDGGDVAIERNSIYLIPPHKEMIMAGGRLLLTESDSSEELSPSVDNFFRSLAQDVGERAFAVVLSAAFGNASHGALAIGEAGGRVIALDEPAKSDAMPTALVETGFVHLPASRIAEALLTYANLRSELGGAEHRHDLPLITGTMQDTSQRKQGETALAAADAQRVKELEDLCLSCPRERALAAANAQLAGILNAATQVSICATDADGTITVFNSGAEEMLGYKSSELVGKKTPGIFHLETEVEQRGKELSREMGREIRGFQVLVAYAKEGRFERREWTYVRKDGRHLTVNLVVTAVRNASGLITGFLGVAEDITERKRSEGALRKSEERFDLAVAGSNDGLWDWDLRTNEVYYAPRFKELLGYGDDEFENTYASFQTHLHPDDRARTLAAVRRHLKYREACDVEYRLRTKSGEYRWFRARGQAVWDDAGRAVRMAGSLADITERKKTEADLAQYAAKIQRANETLRIAEAEARKALLKRDQFLAMLSHELRNPLSAILNGVGVLDHTDADRKAVARARQAIQGQAHHMSRLLDDLLDVARITQGKIDVRKKVLDLNDLIREAAQAMQPAIEARRQRLTVIPALAPVMVEGDPTRLLQIVENLLTNASKYTPSEGAVTLKLKQEADECVLYVRDSGRGIEPDLLDEIFDMFFQSDKALDRSDGGMGVGLTLVRTLVEMHGGTVTAHSDGLGHGSQFVIRLPLTWKPLAESADQASVAAGAVLRILLVEDNPDSRDMLQTILTLDGFQVDVAEDGEQGLEAILTGRPDVALIDVGLPKLDGYEVARRVREKFSKSEIYLVALTGYGQTKDRDAVFQAGFDEHLVKPVNLERLEQLLRAPRNAR